MADSTTSLPVSTSTDGDVVVGVEAGAVIGLDTAANTIKIDPSNNSINIATIAGVAPPVAGKFAIDGVNSTALPVTITGTAGVEKFDRIGPTNVAANLGTATINFDDITAATTGHLLSMVFSSQVQMRCEIQTFDGTTAVTVSDTMTPAGGGAQGWETPGDNYITLAGGTNKHWRVIFTNLDKTKAGDIYATAFWSEV
jgi:hypothetical protein